MTKTYIDVPLVGIQHYRDNYGSIMKKTRKTAKGIIHWDVALIPEDDNPHDSNAVRIDVFGYTLGYVSRDYTQEARDFISKYPNYKYNNTSTEGNIIILSLVGE